MGPLNNRSSSIVAAMSVYVAIILRMSVEGSLYRAMADIVGLALVVFGVSHFFYSRTMSTILRLKSGKSRLAIEGVEDFDIIGVKGLQDLALEISGSKSIQLQISEWHLNGPLGDFCISIVNDPSNLQIEILLVQDSEPLAGTMKSPGVQWLSFLADRATEKSRRTKLKHTIHKTSFMMIKSQESLSLVVPLDSEGRHLALLSLSDESPVAQNLRLEMQSRWEATDRIVTP